MTAPAAETLEREREKLYLTDAEMIRRLGVPDKILRPMLPGLEKNWGFPPRSPIFGGRRYWPAVKSWLDRHNGLSVDPSPTTKKGFS